MKLKFLCKHSYELIKRIPCTFRFNDNTQIAVPIFLFECKKCHRRKVIRDENCFYNSSVLKKLELWLKGEIDMEDI